MLKNRGQFNPDTHRTWSEGGWLAKPAARCEMPNHDAPKLPGKRILSNFFGNFFDEVDDDRGRSPIELVTPSQYVNNAECTSSILALLYLFFLF